MQDTTEPLDPSDPEVQQMLAEARVKARKLVDELKARFAEAEANPPKISPENLKLGREAMQNAIKSAQRMLEALNDAAAVSGGTIQDN